MAAAYHERTTEQQTERIEQSMPSRKSTAILISAVVVFVALTVAGVGMAVSARSIDDTFSQLVLVNVGAAIFGGGLAFFLVQMFWWARTFGSFRD